MKINKVKTVKPYGFKWIDTEDPDYNKDGNWSGPIDLRKAGTNALEIIKDALSGNIDKILKMFKTSEKKVEK